MAPQTHGRKAGPLVIRRDEVLEQFDRVLRREQGVDAVFLFAIDVVESVRDGTVRIDDPAMVAALAELSKMSAVTRDIVLEMRTRIVGREGSGTA